MLLGFTFDFYFRFFSVQPNHLQRSFSFDRGKPGSSPQQMPSPYNSSTKNPIHSAVWPGMAMQSPGMRGPARPPPVQFVVGSPQVQDPRIYGAFAPRRMAPHQSAIYGTVGALTRPLVPSGGKKSNLDNTN